jgi:hypothetical protein
MAAIAAARVDRMAWRNRQARQGDDGMVSTEES